MSSRISSIAALDPASLSAGGPLLWSVFNDKDYSLNVSSGQWIGGGVPLALVVVASQTVVDSGYLNIGAGSFYHDPYGFFDASSSEIFIVPRNTWKRITIRISHRQNNNLESRWLISHNSADTVENLRLQSDWNPGSIPSFTAQFNTSAIDVSSGDLFRIRNLSGATVSPILSNAGWIAIHGAELS